ncbi:hypothetical protein SAMN05443245_3449 [Paraburkholderia fungorum]|uniref:Uncharacterized protein n=1 Tax=Paraburkholderia fungorum TaxID=134537 RepID=A0A1H1H1A7_9BURK|nr:hypothetical protein [Paraburkholderia fungorum]SDR19302.1 hypothetical protein SAMN05443245_3449 [Paraburkholderia fungorum]
MPLQIDFVTPSTGATASYHVVQQVGLDYESGFTNATVASYLSADAKAAGKFSMYVQQIQISGLPDKGTDARDSAEALLIAAPPTDGTTQGASNRYTFAGAEIVQ